MERQKTREEYTLTGGIHSFSHAEKDPTMELVIPVNQMIAFVGIVAFCFLFSRHRLGLSVTFCFTFFWGYIANSSVCLAEIETASPLIILYFVCGIALILLALWSFLVDE